MVASVVSNVSGLMTGGLYLFLRSNTLSTIGPKKKLGDGERTRRKQQIRRFRPGDGGAHMMHSANTDYDLRRMLSDASLISSSAYDKEEEATLVGRGSPVYGMPQSKRPNPLRSNATYPLEDLVKVPQPARTGSSGSSRGKSPYSGVPVPETKPLTVLPATIYTPGQTAKTNRFDFSTLKPPPSIRNLTVGRHRRDSSMASSATVQIGLRLSNVEDMPPLNPVLDKKVYAIECPNLIPKPTDTAKRPTPLTLAAPRPSISDSASEYSVDRDPGQEAKMKTLPPVPQPSEAKKTEKQQAEEDDGPRLSPTVYQPKPQSPAKQTKPPSPQGAGATSPLRSASSAARSPPPRAQANGSPRRAPGTDKGGDWI